jgi:PAP2 superfamily
MTYVIRRLYFFEIFALVNLGAIALLAHDTLPIVGSPLLLTMSFSTSFAVQLLLGVGVRSLVALARRERSYFRHIRRARWIADSLRLILLAGVMVTTYGWIKLVVPIEHPYLYDQQLWDLDRTLLFGFSPNLFVLQLFGAPTALRAVDWSYANIFFASAIVSFGYFLSHPSRRVRVAFANGNAALWIAGAWLYMLLPSLGPAFRFPDIWFAYSDSLRTTQTMQALLMRNYQNVIRAASHAPITEPIRIVFGIGAFPSLHVAFQAYIFLWMRRLWTSGEIVFGIFSLAIFIGSLITGWHYMIDGLVGLVMAALAYWWCWRSAGMPRWMALGGQ